MSSQAKRMRKNTKYALSTEEVEQIIVTWINDQRRKSLWQRLKLARIILKKVK